MNNFITYLKFLFNFKNAQINPRDTTLIKTAEFECK